MDSSTSTQAPQQTPDVTKVYFQPIDDGRAPCVTRANGNAPALLTLALCKPEIRRAAKPGQRIMGITCNGTHRGQKYPLNSIIWIGIVYKVIRGQEYFSATYGERADCIYFWATSTELFVHRKLTNKHTTKDEQKRDLGLATPEPAETPSKRRFKKYKNAWVVLCQDFQYFGKNAVEIPTWAPLLRDFSQKRRQGHRNFERGSVEGDEIERLCEYLRQQPEIDTPTIEPSKAQKCGRGKRPRPSVEDPSSDEAPPKRRRRC